MSIHDEFNTLTLNKGGPQIQCEAFIDVTVDISQTIELQYFADPEAIPEITNFVEKSCMAVANSLLQTYAKLEFKLSVIADVRKVNGEEVNNARINTKKVFLYRHVTKREELIHELILKISNPYQHQETHGDVTVDDGGRVGSSFADILRYKNITISFVTPLQYNANALSTSMMLTPKNKINRFIDYLPYNSDKYCFFHCIVKTVLDQVKTEKGSVNNDKEYMVEFNKLSEQYNFDQYYVDNDFLIDNLPKIEAAMGVSIKVYRSHYEKNVENEVDLYYRSSYTNMNKHTKPINIVLLPMAQFYNKRTKVKNNNQCEVVTLTNDLDGLETLTRMSVREKSDTIQSHAAIFNTNFFKNEGHEIICKYCLAPKQPHLIDQHEVTCLEIHRNTPEKESSRRYEELDNDEKVFERYSAFYRTNFCTYDWETRLEETGINKSILKENGKNVVVSNGKFTYGGKTIKVIDGEQLTIANKQAEVDGKHIIIKEPILRHVPFSFSIFYFNIFKPEKSIIHLFSSENPLELIENFVSKCKDLVVYHHDEIQSVDFATDVGELTKEIRKVGCTFCLQKYNATNKRPEWNHSHMVDDNMNLQYNRYLCSECNKKCTIRGRPLKFLAHNGAKYDQNMFLPTFLNDPTVVNHKFISKTDSRFNEVMLGFYVDQSADITYSRTGLPTAKYKLSFNDSMMLLPGALSKICSAWVNKVNDSPLLEMLMKIQYPEIEDLGPLVNKSFGKQIFPYEALNDLKMLDEKEPIDIKFFRNTFANKACSKKDYETYLDANKVLQNSIGSTYSFQDFHDYYLLLDVVLLGVVLYNFMNLNHELNGLNPLMFLSTSSYSFSALLKHNKYDHKIETIRIPNIETQKFIQRSIKGGFTMIFNKINLKGEKDYTMYTDFTSLYPTIMSKCELPYEFVEFKEIATKSVETILNEIKQDNKHYHFIECDIAALKPEFQKKCSLYPMFPETQTIKADDYSKDQQECSKINSGSDYFVDQTLNTTSFYPKKNYITSWSYPKTAMSVGYEVESIKKVAVFKKTFILKDYIDKVYQLKKEGTIRKKALEWRVELKDQVLKHFKKAVKVAEEYSSEEVVNHYKKMCETTQDEKDILEGELSAESARVEIYKLILNAIYGYTIVNSDRHKEAVMIEPCDDNSRRLLRRKISDPRFISMSKVGNKFILSQMKKSYTSEYPLMIGSAILWESKLLTANYIFGLYDWIEKLNSEIPNGVQMVIHPCFYDTDSCFISIKNFKHHFSSYQEFTFKFNKEVFKVFDASGYDEEYRMPETEGELGFMTNETDGVEIVDYAGVAAKCYSYVTKKEKMCTKGKGISKQLQEDYLSLKLYKSVVKGSIFENFTREKYSVNYNEFKSAKFGVHTVNTTKQYVTLVDLKSYYGTNSSDYAIFGSEKHKTMLANQ